MRQVDLSDRVATPGHAPADARRPRRHRAGYQVVFRYHVPDASGRRGDARSRCRSRLDYDRTTLAVDETVTATATVANRRPDAAPMVILDLPIPAGFALEADDLAALVEAGVDRQVPAHAAERAGLPARPGAGPAADAPLPPPRHDAGEADRPRRRGPTSITTPRGKGSSPAVRLTVTAKGRATCPACPVGKPACLRPGR